MEFAQLATRVDKRVKKAVEEVCRPGSCRYGRISLRKSSTRPPLGEDSGCVLNDIDADCSMATGRSSHEAGKLILAPSVSVLAVLTPFFT